MTNKQIQNKIDKLEESIAMEVSNSTMDLIDELVELNILLEKESNQ